ncbi:MAG: FAD-dependent oxidoreductase [Pseudomonadales bacterium]|jgi:predicted NAD/FAD-binding protein|nr:FAD-dependent oxidoreductase [Pseudomonadales bacterium]
MRIAVVGSGISGLTAAWLLQRHHQVALFEAEARPGGHTHTHSVRVEGRGIRVDTGFIVYNDRNYPWFTRLLTELGVAGRPTEMSFSVVNEATGLEYNGRDLDALFAQRRNLLSPSFWGMLREILRFNREAPKVLGLQGTGPTLGRFLADNRYGEAFARDYLVPMGAAIWSVPTDRMMDFPAARVVEFFRNHGLLSIADRPQWFVVQGGSSTYVERILAALGSDQLRLCTPVRSIERGAEGVTLVTDSERSHFDAVVMACHSDQALALLSDASAEEREILGAIGYQPNDVLLHTDPSVLPDRRKAWASWNYRLPREGAAGVTVSYWMNHLQHIDVETPLIVTLNQDARIDERRVLARERYAHPVFDGPALLAQARRAEINGVRHSWYCGAYWRYGFHEDGCLSAVEVAADLGVQW